MANKKGEMKPLTMQQYAARLVGAQVGMKLAGNSLGKGGSLIAAERGARAAGNILKPKRRAKGGAVKKGK